jgi:hypothetical protein
VPSPHCTCKGLVLPAGQAYPALQGPEQVEVFNAAAAPNCPAGHVAHTPAPAALYLPWAQTDVVLFVLPAGHAYPAVHAPEQLLVVAAAEPHRPASHSPAQAHVGSPVAFPNRPAAQSEHVAAPASAYLPNGHTDPVALVEPVAQE